MTRLDLFDHSYQGSGGVLRQHDEHEDQRDE
jgi:hypothetical protein